MQTRIKILKTLEMTYLYIGLFGLVGVFARYFIGFLIGKALPSAFPFGTFIVNLIGTFLIGILYSLSHERTFLGPDLRIGMTVGLLGGFTTFSSYCLEAVRLAEAGKLLYCVLYLSGSPLAGFLATLFGILMTRKFLAGVP